MALAEQTPAPAIAEPVTTVELRRARMLIDGTWVDSMSGELPQHAPALGGTDLGPAPLVEGAPRRGDRNIDIPFVGFGDIGDDRAGRRVVNRESSAGYGRDELAVDQHQRRLPQKPCRVA